MVRETVAHRPTMPICRQVTREIDFELPSLILMMITVAVMSSYHGMTMHSACYRKYLWAKLVWRWRENMVTFKTSSAALKFTSNCYKWWTGLDISLVLYFCLLCSVFWLILARWQDRKNGMTKHYAKSIWLIKKKSANLSTLLKNRNRCAVIVADQ